MHPHRRVWCSFRYNSYSTSWATFSSALVFRNLRKKSRGRMVFKMVRPPKAGKKIILNKLNADSLTRRPNVGRMTTNGYIGYNGLPSQIEAPFEKLGDLKSLIEELVDTVRMAYVQFSQEGGSDCTNEEDKRGTC